MRLSSLSGRARRRRRGLPWIAGKRRPRAFNFAIGRTPPVAALPSRWRLRYEWPAMPCLPVSWQSRSSADLTLSGESVRAFNGLDPAANRDLLTFMGASYFQGHDPTDPLVSPLFGDLTGLPPLFVTATQREVLLSGAIRLAERAERAGVKVTLARGFRPCLRDLPSSPKRRARMGEVADWARRKSAARYRALESRGVRTQRTCCIPVERALAGWLPRSWSAFAKMTSPDTLHPFGLAWLRQAKPKGRCAVS